MYLDVFCSIFHGAENGAVAHRHHKDIVGTFLDLAEHLSG